MRILLDECSPSRLRNEIAGHDVATVKQVGWLGIKIGRLLKLIGDSGKFDGVPDDGQEPAEATERSRFVIFQFSY